MIFFKKNYNIFEQSTESFLNTKGMLNYTQNKEM
jgi:hypothetical protein